MALYTFRGSQWIPGERIKPLNETNLPAQALIDFHTLTPRGQKLETAARWFLDVTSQSFNNGGILAMKDVQAANVEVLAQYNKISHSGTNFSNGGASFMCRRDSWPGITGGGNNNGYTISRGGPVNNNRMFVRRRNAGTATTVLNSTGGYSGANTRFFRARIDSATLYFKEWDATGTEPVDWDNTVTDGSAITASGYFGFGVVRTSDARFATCSELLNIGFATDGDTVPLPSEWWTGSLAGETENVNEVLLLDWQSKQPIGRTVPDVNGLWDFDTLLPNDYGLIYLGEPCCAPLIHGPYTVTAP